MPAAINATTPDISEPAIADLRERWRARVSRTRPRDRHGRMAPTSNTCGRSSMTGGAASTSGRRRRTPTPNAFPQYKTALSDIEVRFTARARAAAGVDSESGIVHRREAVGAERASKVR